jgi:hypothetical protein
MPATDIPDPLPSAITPPRTVIEFLVDQDLEEFGDTGLVAHTCPARRAGQAGQQPPCPVHRQTTRPR